MNDRSTIMSQIEHGLDRIDENRKVSVPLKDLLFVHQTLGELIRFFHQPMHYPTLERVEEFIGGADTNDGFTAMKRCYYGLLHDCWPPDILEMFDNGDLENPSSPFYFKPVDNGDV